MEVAWLTSGRVGVRDSKDHTGPALIFAAADWDAFTASVEYNPLTNSTG